MKVRTQTFYIVDFIELEKTVRDVFGADWSFVASEEIGNDTQHSFNGIDGSRGDFLQPNYLEEFRSGKRYMYMTRAILDELCRRHIIDPGDYLVEVSW